MQRKTILLGTFTTEHFITSVIERLNDKVKIEKKNIFFFETEYNEILLTYKLNLDIDNKFDIRTELRKTIQLHKKFDTFFTINALNKLIEKENDLDGGNVEYSQYSVDWTKFKDKLILSQRGELDIVGIKKINV